MEVLSFFSNNKNIVSYFSDFMSEYRKLSLEYKDRDTIYFVSPQTGKNELYFHFKLNDIEHEFRYNYSEIEAKYVKVFFGNQPIFSFDIQYRDEVILKEILVDFKHYMKVGILVEQDVLMLISHPHQGILNMIDV